MYRTVNDFLNDWTKSANGTRKVLEALTDEKLDQAIVEGHNTLGWIGWHLATSPAFFAGLVGLQVKATDGEAPGQARKIVEAYQQIAEDIHRQVEETFTDDKMVEKVDHFGQATPRGELLRVMIDHQTHHRGQMTVLLRQAGLPVPGVMGPTKEDQK